ncbi:DinB family protein [Deinococcus apachensis]|uniref:DinB family protein n=1 Tax=Deinococcus apachensis TaxID=309886 RepID=UPI00037758B9|nr:DinB family protein [Deinococcus apachensis]
MTQLDFAGNVAALRAMGDSPEEVRDRLARELGAFEAAVLAAQPQWHETLPFRAWTAAQESEHVILVNEGTARIVALLLSDRPLRPVPPVPGELVEGRRQAPTGTRPGPDQPWETLRERHATAREALLSHAPRATDDPGRRFFHPFMGEITALDWLRMAAFHIRHHRKQLQAASNQG